MPGHRDLVERSQTRLLLSLPMSHLDPGAVAAPTDARIHAFDHLRALAMLAGVLFHAALAYSPMMHGF